MHIGIVHTVMVHPVIVHTVIMHPLIVHRVIHPVRCRHYRDTREINTHLGCGCGRYRFPMLTSLLVSYTRHVHGATVYHPTSVTLRHQTWLTHHHRISVTPGVEYELSIVNG